MKNSFFILLFFLCLTVAFAQKQRFDPAYDVFWEYNESTHTLIISGNDIWNTFSVNAFESIKRGDVMRIVVEKGIRNIPNRAFKNYSTLKGFHVDENDAFENLKEVVLPEGLEIIGFQVFSGCNHLTKINLPNSLKRIEYEAFYKCESLEIDNFPPLLEFIGISAFSCTNIRHVYIPYKVDFDSAYINKHDNRNCAFSGCSVLERACVSPTYYVSYMFSGCHHLRYVEIMDGGFLGKNMFDGCRKLDTIVLNSKIKDFPPLFGNEKEDRVNPVIVIIPDGTLKYYQKKAKKDPVNAVMLKFVERSNANITEPIVVQNEKLAETTPKPESTQPGKSETDIDIPSVRRSSNNTYAFIIANENYAAKPVPFALNDGRIFAQYCVKTLGLKRDHVILYENATVSNLIGCVEQMKNASKANDGKLDIIFYYAGHAFPDEESKTAWLLPVDGSINLKRTCYSLKQLYKDFAEVNANSVVCFIDACFSGATRENEMLLEGRGVAIKVKDEIPLGNIIVFTSSTGAETAHQYREKSHGLFTYYLLKKLQDSKGDVTLGELDEYITTNVKRASFEVNHKLQTPTVIPSSSIQGEWKNIKLVK